MMIGRLRWVHQSCIVVGTGKIPDEWGNMMAMDANAQGFAQKKMPWMTRLIKRKQKGVTLVELTVAVAVMGVLTAGALVAVPELMASVKASKETKDMSQMVAKAHSAMAMGVLIQKPTNIAALVAAQVMDHYPESATGVTARRNAFGGDVSVEALAPNTLTSGFTLAYKNVPTKACQKIISEMKDNFVHISTNRKVVKTYPADLVVAEVPVACGVSDGTGSGTNKDTVNTVTLNLTFSP